MPDVFASYARKDSDRVEAIAAEIETAGLRVWSDKKLMGERFDDEIKKQIDRAFAVVCFWSRNAARSDYVKGEISWAARRESPKGSERIVIVRIDDISPQQLPLQFSGLDVINLSTWRPGSSCPSGITKLIARCAALRGTEVYQTPNDQRDTGDEALSHLAGLNSTTSRISDALPSKNSLTEERSDISERRVQHVSGDLYGYTEKGDVSINIPSQKSSKLGH